MLILLMIVVLLAWPSALNAQAPAQAQKLIRVILTNQQQVQQLLSLHLDLASHHVQRYADVLVTAEQEQQLLDNGFKLETLIPDLQRDFEKRFAGKPDLGDYHTVQEMYDEMLAIANANPNIAMLTSIGQSIEGRDIWAMKVSDNPSMEEAGEPDLLYMANMHAREMVVPEVILYFLNHLVDNYGVDSDITELVDNREFWIIPTQNPDGHVHVEQGNPLWRKNRRNNGDGTYGVDLNRNYGYQWGYDNIGSSPFTGDQTYRGMGPFSEPESEAIRQLALEHEFVISLSYHSYGRLWLYPWGYVPQNTLHHDVFVELAKNCVAGNGYLPGNPANGAIYLTNGGTDDYFYGEQVEKNLVFGFTPEVGDEFWPPESDIPILAQENLPANLYLAEVTDILADNPYRVLAPASPVINPLGLDNDGNYTVSWTIEDDPDNPAVAYQLDELGGYEEMIDGAEVDSGNWRLGGFSYSAARSFRGSQSFHSGQGDNLNNVMEATYPMLVTNSHQLIMQMWYDIETHWDYGYVEVSIDGGESYNSIPGNVTTDTNPNGMNQGNGITGSSSGWIQGLFDLSTFAGQSIQLRFRYVTDQIISGEGIYVDEITPVPTFAMTITLADDIVGTSFSVSGRSSATYYYRARARDAEEQWGGWSPIEDIVVNVAAGKLGDINNDEACNSTDALLILSNGAGLPIPPDSRQRIDDGFGDINGDGLTNSSDALILLSVDVGLTVPFDVCTPFTP